MYKLFFLPMLMQRGILSSDQIAEQKIQRERIIERHRIEEYFPSSKGHNVTQSSINHTSTSKNSQKPKIPNPKLECFDECFGNLFNFWCI